MFSFLFGRGESEGEGYEGYADVVSHKNGEIIPQSEQSKSQTCLSACWECWKSALRCDDPSGDGTEYNSGRS